ncbi:LuxR C-terminal-related transcriptional regulator [Cohnella suwonensis]|uniref:LuxR C-terminal-related transcriptional regulator n=1 Tax=Cohnella suwonensis TaxID=696072 RepID=A0ABW0M0E9_9BACL
MMILHTKLHIPHSRREILIDRPRLMELLNEGLKAKLTAVTAPAGYGKTTALSEWARQCGCPAAWISLDRYDNDLVQFWSCVIAAVEQVCPSFGEALSLHVEHMKSSGYDSFIAALLNELNDIPRELALILDDFQVIELSSIYDSVAYVLEHLPPHIHFYTASRFDLPFPTAKLQAKGHLQKIYVQDLRFQREEGIRYLHDCMRILLSREEADLLVHRTEGWVSGLHLAALSLKRSADPSGFIRDFGGQHRDISQYLLEELLERQSEEISDFLLQTSITSRMNDSLCEAMTGRASCGDQLEALKRQNMFIILLDEIGEWYRYHHLFADFLQQQFRRKQPDKWAETHANAARWLGANGFYEEAIDHFLACGNYTEATSLIEGNLSKLHLKRTMVQQWLSILPESVLDTKPGIQCQYIKMLSETGELALAETKLKAIQNKLSEPDWQPWKSFLLLIAAEIALYRKDIPRTSEYLEMYEQHAPEGSPLQMIAGNTARVNCYTVLEYFDDLHEADAFFRRWIEVWGKKENYPFAGYLYLAYSKLLYEWNRLDEAEMYAERTFWQKPMQPYARILVQAAVGAARIRYVKGDAEGAAELLEQVKSKLHSPDNPLFFQELETERAALSVNEPSADEAAAWLQSCGLAPSDNVPVNRVREYLHYARALIACGQADEAMGLLDRMYRLVRHEDRLIYVIQVLIVQSKALHHQRDTPHALMKLEAALHLAEPQGYIRSFVDEGATMAQLLAEYLHCRQTGHIRESLSVSLLYVKKLLLHMNVRKSGASDSPSPLTMQETKILRMVHEGLMRRQIAERINVTDETVKKHMKNIYKKLDASSRMQALQRGKELNLL